MTRFIIINANSILRLIIQIAFSMIATKRLDTYWSTDEKHARHRCNILTIYTCSSIKEITTAVENSSEFSPANVSTLLWIFTISRIILCWRIVKKLSWDLCRKLSKKLRKIENSILKTSREVIVRRIVEKLSKKLRKIENSIENRKSLKI